MELEISTDKQKLDLNFVHNYLSKDAYWAKGRSMERVQQSIENSVCFGAFLNGKQIGFARVATDKVVIAWVMDVFVDEQYRGKGYGEQLMKAVVEDPIFSEVKNWGLMTKDATKLYEKVGFGKATHPDWLMVKANTNLA